MSIWSEFKAFAMRGNMVDLAVGVVLGAAFGKVVSSLVGDVIMPPIGLLIGGVDFSSLAITMKEASGTAPAVKLNYGQFINSLIDFLIISAAIFVVVKLMNTLKKEEAPTQVNKECPYCLMQIPKSAKKCAHCCSEVF